MYLATDTAPSTLILYAAASRKRVASTTLDMSDGVPRAMAFNPLTREIIVAFYDEAGTLARISAGPPMVSMSNVTLRNGPNAEHQYQFNAALVDETGTTLIVGTDNSPGAVLRLDARTLQQAPGSAGLHVLPEGQDSVMALEWVPRMPAYSIAANSQVMYVTYTEPIFVGKLRASDLSDVEPPLQLNFSENNAVSTAVDVVRGRLYIGTEYTPADIVVVEIFPVLRRIGSLGVDTAIGVFPVIPSAFSTPYAAYFATDSSVPTLLRVDFNTSIVTAVTLLGDLPVFVCALSLRNATMDRLAVNAMLGIASSPSTQSASLRMLTAAAPAAPAAAPEPLPAGSHVGAAAPASSPATTAFGLGADPAVFVSSTSPGKVLLFPDIATSFIPDVKPAAPRGYTAFQIASGIIVLIAIAVALLLLAFLTCAWMLQRRLKRQAAESLRRVVVAEKAIALLAKTQETADARTRRAQGYRRLDLGVDGSGRGDGSGKGGDGSDSPTAGESGLNPQLFDLLSATLEATPSVGGSISSNLTTRSSRNVHGGGSLPRRGSSKGRIAFRPSRTSSSSAMAAAADDGGDGGSSSGGGMSSKRPSLRDAVDAARSRISGSGRVGSTRNLASGGANNGPALARLVRRVKSRGGGHDTAIGGNGSMEPARSAVDSARLTRLANAVTADMLTHQAAAHAASIAAGDDGGPSNLPAEVLRTFIAATVEAAASVLANPEAARAELARGMRSGSMGEDGELVPLAVQVLEGEEGAVPEHAEAVAAAEAAEGAGGPQRVRLTQVVGAREMIKQVRSVGGGLKRRAEDTTVEVASAKAHRQKLLKMTQSQLRIATDAPGAPGVMTSLPSSPALTPFVSADPSALGKSRGPGAVGGMPASTALATMPSMGGPPLRRLGSGGQKAQLLELIVSVAAKRAAVAVAQCEDEATRDLVMATLLGEGAGGDFPDLDGDDGLGGVGAGGSDDGHGDEEDLADGFHEVVEVRESSDLGLLGSMRRLPDGSTAPAALADSASPEAAAASAAAAAARAERRSTKEKLRASMRSVVATQARAAKAAQKTAGFLSPLAVSDGLRKIVEEALARTGDIAAKEALAALMPEDATAAAAVLAARRIERAGSSRGLGEKKRDSASKRRRRARSTDRPTGGGRRGASKSGGMDKGAKAGAATPTTATAGAASPPTKRGAFIRLFTSMGSSSAPTPSGQAFVSASGRVTRTSGGFAIPIKALRGGARKSVVTSAAPLTAAASAMSMSMSLNSGLASTKPPADEGHAAEHGHSDGRPLSLNFKSNPLVQAKGRDGAAGSGRGGSRPSSVGSTLADGGDAGAGAGGSADGMTGAVVNPMRAATAAADVEAKAAGVDPGAAAAGVAAHSGDHDGEHSVGDDDDDDDYDSDDGSDDEEEPSGDEGDGARLMSRSERMAREAQEVGRILNSVTWAAAISATKDRLVQRILRICPCLRCCRCLRERSYARPAHEKVGLAALPTNVRKRLSKANAKESRLAVEAAGAGAGGAGGGSKRLSFRASAGSPAAIGAAADDTRAALAAAVLALCNPGADGGSGAFQLPLFSPRSPGAGGAGGGGDGNSEPSTPGSRGRAAVISAANRIMAVSRLQRSMGSLAADAAARASARVTSASADGSGPMLAAGVAGRRDDGDAYSPASASSGSSATGPSGLVLSSPALSGASGLASSTAAAGAAAPGPSGLLAAAKAFSGRASMVGGSVGLTSARASIASTGSAGMPGMHGVSPGVASMGMGMGMGGAVTSSVMPRIDHRASVRASVAFAASGGIAGILGSPAAAGLEALPAGGSAGGDAGSAGSVGSDAGFRPEPAMHPFHLKQLQRQQQQQQQQYMAPGMASLMAAGAGSSPSAPYDPRAMPAHLMAASGSVPAAAAASQRPSIAPARAFIYSLEAGSMGFAPSHVSHATATHGGGGGAFYGPDGAYDDGAGYDAAVPGSAVAASGTVTPARGVSPAASAGFAHGGSAAGGATASPHAPSLGPSASAAASASASARGLAASASVRSSSRRLGSAVSSVRAFKGRRSIDVRGSAMAVTALAVGGAGAGATGALADGLRTLDAAALHALGSDDAAPHGSDQDNDDAGSVASGVAGGAGGDDAALGVAGISPPESPSLDRHRDAAADGSTDSRSASPAVAAPGAANPAAPGASSSSPAASAAAAAHAHAAQHHGHAPSLTTAQPTTQLRTMPVPPPAPAAARSAAIMATDASWAE